MTYESTRTQVETYFDSTATQVWARLTSDAPVSRVRETVRAGRDRMRALMMSRLPEDLTGCRVLDAGCGTGLGAVALAERGADVLAVDISPALVKIAEERLPQGLKGHVRFQSADMLAESFGPFDYVFAMDSLIYYKETDLTAALGRLAERTERAIVFTVPPRTPLLMAMWQAGKFFPRADRSPSMVPHAPRRLRRRVAGRGELTDLGRVTSGFYISQALELAP